MQLLLRHFLNLVLIVGPSLVAFAQDPSPTVPFVAPEASSTPVPAVVLEAVTPTAPPSATAIPPASAAPTTPAANPQPTLQPLAPAQGTFEPPSGFPFDDDSPTFTLSISDDPEPPKPPKPVSHARLEFLELLFPIIGILAVTGCPVLIVAAILIYRQRKNRLMHDTIRQFVEKGVPIPSEFFRGDGKPLPTTSSDFRKGIMLTCIGVGLVLFFLAMGIDVWGVGFIPLGIGVGHLLSAKFAPPNDKLP